MNAEGFIKNAVQEGSILWRWSQSDRTIDHIHHKLQLSQQFILPDTKLKTLHMLLCSQGVHNRLLHYTVGLMDQDLPVFRRISSTGEDYIESQWQIKKRANSNLQRIQKAVSRMQCKNVVFCEDDPNQTAQLITYMTCYNYPNSLFYPIWNLKHHICFCAVKRCITGCCIVFIFKKYSRFAI